MSSSIINHNDNPTLSLCGESYFFCGPKTSSGRFQDATGFRDGQFYDVINDRTAAVYVVLGPNNQYFRCTSPRDGDVETVCDSNLDSYGELADFLDEHNTVRPHFLSLGCGGHFYARTGSERAEKWDVSMGVLAGVFQKHESGSEGIESLWLGRLGAFVAQRWAGPRGKVFDLRGQYPGLQRILEERFQDQQYEDTSYILSLAMDLDDGVSFVVVWQDGTAHRAPGMKDTDVGRVFGSWCLRNGFNLTDLG